MKFRKIMAAVTLAGIFLTGIGAGVGFVEFSGFEYQGGVVLGEENEEETRLVWELGDENFISLHPYIPNGDTEDITVEKDAKVPKDEVWFDVVYNLAWGEPYLVSFAEDREVWDSSGEYLEERLSDETDEKLSYAEIWPGRSPGVMEEVKIIMEVKDRFLRELREKKFSTYSYPSIFSVKVRVNPSNYERIELMNR